MALTDTNVVLNKTSTPKTSYIDFSLRFFNIYILISNGFEI